MYAIRSYYAPPAGYMDLPSRIIPPESHENTPAFSVPECPGGLNDAFPLTTEYCEASTSINVPPLAAEPGTDGTSYYLHLLLSDGNVPGDSQIFRITSYNVCYTKLLRPGR